MSHYNKDIAADARLASSAYGDTAPTGYTVDWELSNPVRKVYVNKEGKATVAFRGTKLKDRGVMDELATDALIGLGLQNKSNRFKKDVDVTNRAIAKYGRENVSLTGHSMGGSRAAYVSRATGTKGRAFDPAFSPIDVLRKRTYSNVHAFRTVNDLVSVFAPKVRTLKTTSIQGKRGHGAHSLFHFWN